MSGGGPRARKDFSCLFPVLCLSTQFGKQQLFRTVGGALVSTGMKKLLIAGRGAAGLVKSGTIVIANNDDYAYAYAA